MSIADEGGKREADKVMNKASNGNGVVVKASYENVESDINKIGEDGFN